MAGISLVISGFALTIIMTRSDVTGMVGSGEASGGDRLLAWKAAMGMLLDHPIFGVGWTHFTEYCRSYGLDKKLIAHNTPLSVLAETGLLGFSLFLTILLMTFRQLYKMVRMYRHKQEHEEFYILCYGMTISLVCFQLNSFFSVKDHEAAYWLILMMAGGLWLIHLKQEQQIQIPSAAEELLGNEALMTQ